MVKSKFIKDINISLIYFNMDWSYIERGGSICKGMYWLCQLDIELAEFLNSEKQLWSDLD